MDNARLPLPGRQGELVFGENGENPLPGGGRGFCFVILAVVSLGGQKYNILSITGGRGFCQGGFGYLRRGMGAFGRRSRKGMVLFGKSDENFIECGRKIDALEAGSVK